MKTIIAVKHNDVLYFRNNLPQEKGLSTMTQRNNSQTIDTVSLPDNKPTDIATIPEEFKLKTEPQKRRNGDVWTYIFLDKNLSKQLKSSKHLREYLKDLVEWSYHRTYTEKYGLSVYYVRRDDPTIADYVTECLTEYREEHNKVDDTPEEDDAISFSGFDNDNDNDNVSPENDDTVSDIEDTFPSWVLTSHEMTIRDIFKNLDNTDNVTIDLLQRVIENENQHTLNDGSVKPRSTVEIQINKRYGDVLSSGVDNSTEIQQTTTNTEEKVTVGRLDPVFNPNNYSEDFLLSWVAVNDGKLSAADISTMIRNVESANMSKRILSAVKHIHAKVNNPQQTLPVVNKPTENQIESSDTVDKVQLLGEVTKQLAQIAELLGRMAS